jgi:RNA polymerase sigma factor (sigma-70 family)
MCFKTDLEELQPTLNRYVSSRILNKEDASDIVQNTNHIAIRKESECNSNKNFDGWIITIAKFQIKAYLTKIKRANKKGITVPLDEETMGSTWLSDVPFAHLIEEERMELIKGVNERLSKKESLIFDLLTKGLTAKEISVKLKYPYGTVSSLRVRAIKKIKKLIKERQEQNKYDFK